MRKPMAHIGISGLEFSTAWESGNQLSWNVAEQLLKGQHQASRQSFMKSTQTGYYRWSIHLLKLQWQSNLNPQERERERQRGERQEKRDRRRGEREETEETDREKEREVCVHIYNSVKKGRLG